MMGLGLPEMLFIFGAALLLFGPRKLPEIGRTLGKGMAEFRKASAELRRTLDTEAIEHEVRETKRAVQENDPRRYLREAADLDQRRVARGQAEPPSAEADEESADPKPTDRASVDGTADVSPTDVSPTDSSPTDSPPEATEPPTAGNAERVLG